MTKPQSKPAASADVAGVLNPEAIAAAIIRAANNGYHGRDDYPAYALTPWDDRRRWSAYIEIVAAGVIADALRLAATKTGEGAEQ
jgi:hypothetical protein